MMCNVNIYFLLYITNNFTLNYYIHQCNNFHLCILNTMYADRLIPIEIFGRGMNISNNLIRGTKLKILINNTDCGHTIVDYIANRNKNNMKNDKHIRCWVESNIFDIIHIFDCYYRNNHNFSHYGLYDILRKSVNFNSDLCYLTLHRVIRVSQILEIDQRILKPTGDWLSSLNYVYIECYYLKINSPEQKYRNEVEQYLQSSYGYNKLLIDDIDQYTRVKIFNKTLSLGNFFVQRTKLKECIEIDDDNKNIEKLLISYVEKENIELDDYIIDVLTSSIKIIDNHHVNDKNYKQSFVKVVRQHAITHQKISLLMRYKIMIFVISTLSVDDTFIINDKHILQDLHLAVALLMRYSSGTPHSFIKITDIKQTLDAILDHIHPKVNEPTLCLPIILMNNNTIKNKISQQLKANYFSTLRFI